MTERGHFEETPKEETVQLEPCMICGGKAAVDELITVPVPSGFGLVCRDCFGPEMRSCGYCGEKFTIDELVPIDTQFGPVLACEICHEEVREQAVPIADDRREDKAKKAAEASSPTSSMPGPTSCWPPGNLRPLRGITTAEWVMAVSG